MNGRLFATGFVVISMFSHNVLAREVTDIVSDYFRTSKKVLTVTLGPDFAYQGDSHNLTLVPPFSNTDASSKHWEVVGDFGGFVGIEHKCKKWLSIQTGIAGYGNTAVPITGKVLQYGVPDFDNFRYSYHVNHGRIMFSNKVLTTLNRYPKLKPYFTFELGAAFNRATAYQETPLIDLPPMAPFANHSKTSFTWGLGFGEDYTINDHFRFGIGYQLADLGAASLGMTTAETTDQTLEVAPLWSNQLRFQLSYIS